MGAVARRTCEGVPDILRASADPRGVEVGTGSSGAVRASTRLLKPVCEDCQRQLNVKFEIPAHDLLKKVLDREELTLSSADQVVLGSWYAKTAFVAAMGDRDQGLPFIEHCRQEVVEMVERRTPRSTFRYASQAIKPQRCCCAVASAARAPTTAPG